MPDVLRKGLVSSAPAGLIALHQAYGETTQWSTREPDRSCDRVRQ